MALQQKSKPGHFVPEKSDKGDLHRFLESVQSNPWLYIGGIVFVAACVIAGLIYRQSTLEKDRTITTEIARALAQTTPEMKASDLAKLAEGAGRSSAEAVYLSAEAAYDAGRYEEAKAAFERLRADFADSPYTPDAVEGLGYIAENNEDLETAAAMYQEIQTKWPESFAARRQSLNMGRVLEAQGKFKEAGDAYQTQVDGFPGSSVAARAQEKLTALKAAHPDLFPAPVVEASATPDGAVAAPVDATSAEPATDAASEAAPSLELQLPDTDLNISVDPNAVTAPDTTEPAAEQPAAPAQ
ncbi:MAG: hypothetical protein AMXMBFR84_08340 [Candidatus Hydrogenedentota bacterium]